MTVALAVLLPALLSLLPLSSRAATSATEECFPSMEAMGEWLMGYYQAPDPGRLHCAVTSIADSSLYDDPGGRMMIVSFFSALLASEPGSMAGLYETADQSCSGRTRDLALHVFWLVDTAQSRGLFARAREGWGEPTRELADRLITGPAPLPIQDRPVTEPGDLDNLWATFFATGREEPIRCIVSVLALRSEGHGMELLLGAAAQWSLGANARRHPRVREILELMAARETGEMRRRLEEVLATARGEPEAPSAEGSEHLEEPTELDLSDKEITDDELARIAGNPRLRTLLLKNTRITDEGLAHLGKLSHLGFLRLDGTAITGQGLGSLRALVELKVLILNDTQVDDAGLAHLKGLRELGQLDLDGTLVTDAGLEHLIDMPALGYLSLGRTRITDAGMARLARMQALVYLQVADTMITDAGLEHLERLQRMETLVLDGTKITDAGAPSLASLKKLDTLYLRRTEITDRAIERLTSLPELQYLHLRQTHVGDAGVAHLARMPALRELDLSDTKVSDAGLLHLQGLRQIFELDLSGTPVSDEGLAHLASLKQLRYLRIKGTRVTDAGVAALVRILPELEVRR